MRGIFWGIREGRGGEGEERELRGWKWWMVCEGRMLGALGVLLDFVMVRWDDSLVSWRCLSGVLLAATDGMVDEIEGCAGCVPINDTCMLRDAIRLLRAFCPYAKVSTNNHAYPAPRPRVPAPPACHQVGASAPTLWGSGDRLKYIHEFKWRYSF
jgi:hypothetical protein